MVDAWLFSARALRTVARAGTAALLDTGRIELTAHDGVLDADVLHAAAAQKYDRVFLERVPLAWDVGRYLHAICQADTGNLTDSGVRLSRGLGGHLRTHSSLKGRRVEGRAIRERVETARQRDDLGLARLVSTTFLGELIDGCHKNKTRGGSRAI